MSYQSKLGASNRAALVDGESPAGVGLGKFVLLLGIVNERHAIPEGGEMCLFDNKAT